MKIRSRELPKDDALHQIWQNEWETDTTNRRLTRLMRKNEKQKKLAHLTSMGKEMGLERACGRVQKLIADKNIEHARALAAPFIGDIQMTRTLMRGAIILAYRGEGDLAISILETARVRRIQKKSMLYLNGASGVHEWLLAHEQAEKVQKLEQLIPRWMRDVLAVQRLIYQLDGQQPIDRISYFAQVKNEIANQSVCQDALYAGAMIYQWQTGERQKADEISQKIQEPMIRELAERYLANTQ